ncbi:hypothetical protein [Maridesulfovibrio bastinii]|jgi:hypothetical protein|uniref:hypothetical protein n=1 Tax=Maridesulfovibrio bastinii TaxID=47157 RepID=UPI00042540EA|nr:hypothetical protein [Maridesulfovibrio bastinii]
MGGEFVENIILFLVIIFGISYMVRKRGADSGFGLDDKNDDTRDEIENEKEE